MRRHETPSSAGSNAPQITWLRRAPSGRLRLTILLATVAAFLLVPAAQALANGTLTVNIEGIEGGSGAVSSVGGIFGAHEGSPPIECSGPPTIGVCEDEIINEEGIEGVIVYAAPAPGSEFAGWEVSGEHAFIGCEPESEFEGKKFCLPFGLEGEEPNISITPYFACEEGEICGSEPTTFPLTVTTEGTGEGAVTSTPAGINCGSECEAEFEEGEEVELSQSAETGSEFVEWGGSCSGSGSCEVTMSEAKEVTATFDLEPTPEFELEVNIAGSGEGEIECEVESGPVEPCEAQFEEGAEVALVPDAETGSEFSGWSEDCTGTGACELTMDEAKSVTATFDLESETLTVEVEGPGAVTAPEDIDCPGVCAGAYNYGETVTLSAEADSGAELVEWSGECDSVTGNECEVEMTADKTVEAVFALEPTPEFNLTIVKAGTGSGSVTCNAGACASSYEEGTEVTLAASAASGSTFSGWSGAGCSGTASCKVTINADTSVTATFTANPKPEETCATNASLCPPPPPAVEGKAKAAGTASVKSGKASLKLTCTGGPCKGTVQLTVKVKQGKKTKSLVIGKASFSLSEGATTTVKVKLSGPAKSELAKGKTLKAKTGGSGVSASTVKLKQAKK